MFDKRMVAYEESPEAARALHAEIDLAKALHAELTVGSVIDPLPIYFSSQVSPYPADKWFADKKAAYTALQQYARHQAAVAHLWFEAEVVDGDEIGSVVASAKKHHADLLVLGMRKHSVLYGDTGYAAAARARLTRNQMRSQQCGSVELS